MKNLTLFCKEEIKYKNSFFCCFENLKRNTQFLLVAILFMGSFIQGVSAQGASVPSCNINGPLEACAVPAGFADTSGDIIINIDVARSGAGATLTYSFPSNSSGAIIRTIFPQVYNPTTNRTSQTLVVFPGTTISEFNLQLNVRNNASSPNTFCECSKSVSISRVAATSSYSPILCFGELSTLTAVGSLSDQNSYTYTLLPSGPTNTTGVFPGLPGSVAGITYTVLVTSAEQCSTTISQTITEPALTPVILNCPANTTSAVCLSQSDLNTAFNNWLNSFSFSGGTSPVTITRTPTNPTPPPLCGGSVDVTWSAIDFCGNTAICTKTFTVPAPPPVVLTCPVNTQIGGGQTQAAVNAAFESWLLTVSASGGCNGVLTNNNTGAPDKCGGSKTVIFTYTSTCVPLVTTCEATFTVNQCASIGNFVWNDANFNGIQDGGESGVPGVTVTLYKCSDNSIVAVQVTGSSGEYLFSGLAPGDYYVGFSGFPPGFVMTGQNAGANDAIDSDGNPATGLTSCITLAPGENNTTVDQGINLSQATLGNFVWEDLNNNGLQEAGEPGVAGVTVKLYTCAGALVATQVTAANGQYLFTGLAPGSYKVEFAGLPALPASYFWFFSPKNAPLNSNANDAIDSDADTAGFTACVTLAPGETNLTVDAGIHREQCFESCTGNQAVGATIFTINANNTVTIRTTFKKTFVDNTYGTNAVGWSNGHTFGNLTGSDHLQLQLLDKAGTVKLHLKLDYITLSTVTPQFPSGYRSLGVTGGDGAMIVGSEARVLSSTTSLEKNLNNPNPAYRLFTNSPATSPNTGWNVVDPQFNDWIFEVWYEVVVSLADFGTGNLAFDRPTIFSVHASPSKTGNNTECVQPCEPVTVYATGSNGCGTGSCIGSATAVAAHGALPYTYSWVGPNGPLAANTATVTGLCPGTYTVTAIASLGGSATAQVTIGAPAPEPCGICYESCTGNTKVGATQTVTDNGNGTTTIRTTFAKTFVDNTYGTNAVGWPNGHKFGDLTGSDKLQLALYDIGGVKKLEFTIDYLSSTTVSATSPSGFKSLGVSGGEGKMILGSATNVVSARTSLDVNLNTNGPSYYLKTNSPLTNASYATNLSPYPNWIYDVWYEVTVRNSAFPGGFGYPRITSVHASPSKTGNNTECVKICGTTARAKNSLAKGMDVTIYPNPSNEIFNLNVNTSSEEIIKVVVYDMLGRLIQKMEVTPNEMSELQFGDRYPTGVYNVIVTQGTERKTERIIKYN